MKFVNDGAVNTPCPSDGMWFLTRHKRWGLLKEHPDCLTVARQVNQIALHKEAASALKVSLPKKEMRSAKFDDGVVWDGKNPAAYADGFRLRA
jgi:nitrate/nitrite transport system substrate-binding protein